VGRWRGQVNGAADAGSSMVVSAPASPKSPRYLVLVSPSAYLAHRLFGLPTLCNTSRENTGRKHGDVTDEKYAYI
jgi:hypothetical protein